MRWWGWGADGHAPVLPAHALGFLDEELGPGRRRAPPVALQAVRLPASELPAPARRSLEDRVGRHGVRDDHACRVAHCAGRSYSDLLGLRSGRPQGAPDAVVFPADAEQVAAVLSVCAREGVAVVPFGGGTSVVGGVAPLRGACGSVIALDLSRLQGLVGVDRRSLTAVVSAGTRAPALEKLLATQDLTLGHFPQSFEYVSIGGCVATRSAGQASTGYGRIDDLVLGLRCATPTGELALGSRPASAAGPDLRELLVGSEGALGVITQVSLQVSPRPAVRRYEGMFFSSFAEGADALRAAVQAHVAPHVARLSDEQETRLTLALAGESTLSARLGGAYLRARGYSGGCLVIVGWEGSAQRVEGLRAEAMEVLLAHGALRLGRRPGEAWERSRFSAPYLRDDLLGHGVMVETLETAAPWSTLGELHGAVADALRRSLGDRGTPPLVGCHISHLYASGASLYFTFLARQQEGQELEQWRAAKSAASRAIVAAGATITHHHGVGRDHAPWLEAETGRRGLAALRALKAELDPDAIMNPGKLLAG